MTEIVKRQWANRTIWWHVYPLGFAGAPIWEHADPAPRLRRLLGWLDYAASLGFTGLLLGPIFTARTHGYDSLNQFEIDPRLGTMEDFEDLVAAARSRGMRVVLDGVFSHVGSAHPQLAVALAEGRDGPAARLFDVDWDAPSGPSPRVFEGHGDLVRLDHHSTAAEDYVGDVMEFWLARGIDGWRLDAAYSVDPAFWARVLTRVRPHYPEAWFLGEVIHGDYAGFVRASGVDSVTQYELWKAIWSSLADRNLFELDWTLRRHAELLASFIPNTFIGNHDVTRIASTLGAAGAVVALAVLMTVSGIPSIYYGDEQGFTGVKEERFGGDDAVRPAFPDSPGDLSPLGRPVLDAHRALIALRRERPWLTTARTEVLDLTNTHMTYRASSGGGDHLDVTLDLKGTPSASICDAAGTEIWRTDT